MRGIPRCLILVFAVLATPSFAQVFGDAQELLDPAGVRPLQWSEWVDFHRRLGERIESGRLPLDGAGLASARTAWTDLSPLLDTRGDFARLSVREADALVVAHNRLIDAVALGDDQLLQCAQRQPLGSRRKITECRTAGADAQARAAARAGLSRLLTRPAADG